MKSISVSEFRKKFSECINESRFETFMLRKNRKDYVVVMPPERFNELLRVEKLLLSQKRYSRDFVPR